MHTPTSSREKPADTHSIALPSLYQPSLLDRSMYISPKKERHSGTGEFSSIRCTNRSAKLSSSHISPNNRNKQK